MKLILAELVSANYAYRDKVLDQWDLDEWDLRNSMVRMGLACEIRDEVINEEYEYTASKLVLVDSEWDLDEWDLEDPMVLEQWDLHEWDFEDPMARQALIEEIRDEVLDQQLVIRQKLRRAPSEEC
jgi:hypothetical protein